jgi:predicted DsbA family dithiol-disulfide isomerase
MKQQLMDLYFTQGADLSDRDVLVKAAADCGLDGERIRALLASDADVATVEQAANSAKDSGIDGVPFFVFGGLLAVSGAQPADHLAAAITRAAAERRKKLAQATA